MRGCPRGRSFCPGRSPYRKVRTRSRSIWHSDAMGPAVSAKRSRICARRLRSRSARLTMSIYLRIVRRCDENLVSWSFLKQQYACAPPICAAAARSNSTATKSPNVLATRIIAVFLRLTGRYTVLWAGLKRWACFRVGGKTRRFPLARIVRVAACTFLLPPARPPLEPRVRQQAENLRSEPCAVRCPHDVALDAPRGQRRARVDMAIHVAHAIGVS